MRREAAASRNANYLNATIEDLPEPGENADCRWKGVPVDCGPRGLPTGYVQLLNNNGDGTFTDVSRASGVASASGAYPLTAVAADYDNDGWPDIYVACDSTPSWLFRNQHDGTFRQEALERGVALSEDPAGRSRRSPWKSPAHEPPAAASHEHHAPGRTGRYAARHENFVLVAAATAVRNARPRGSGAGHGAPASDRAGVRGRSPGLVTLGRQPGDPLTTRR